jgi:hypothetical protein
MTRTSSGKRRAQCARRPFERYTARSNAEAG